MSSLSYDKLFGSSYFALLPFPMEKATFFIWVLASTRILSSFVCMFVCFLQLWLVNGRKCYKDVGRWKYILLHHLVSTLENGGKYHTTKKWSNFVGNWAFRINLRTLKMSHRVVVSWHDFFVVFSQLHVVFTGRYYSNQFKGEETETHRAPMSCF